MQRGSLHGPEDGESFVRSFVISRDRSERKLFTHSVDIKPGNNCMTVNIVPKGCMNFRLVRRTRTDVHDSEEITLVSAV